MYNLQFVDDCWWFWQGSLDISQDKEFINDLWFESLISFNEKEGYDDWLFISDFVFVIDNDFGSLVDFDWIFKVDEFDKAGFLIEIAWVDLEKLYINVL